MATPFSLMSAGYPKTLSEIRAAIEKRIKNATNRLSYTPNYHRGTPDPNNLPDETLGVWLDWDNTQRDPDEPYQATMLMTNWRIYIIAKDEGNDQFGSDTPLHEQIWGDILKTFTETNADISPEGSCDYVPTPEANQFTGTISGGDRRVRAIEISLTTFWQQELNRPCPP